MGNNLKTTNVCVCVRKSRWFYSRKKEYTDEKRQERLYSSGQFRVIKKASQES